MKQTQIFLIDDSQIHLVGLRLLLEQNALFNVCGEARYPEEVLNNPALTKAEVILLDAQLHNENDGIKLIKPLLEKFPGLKIIMLSHNKDITSIIQSIKAGAMAYISKDTSTDELYLSIEMVMKGNGLFLGETIPKSALINCFTSLPVASTTKTWNLSQREIEIIEYLSRGLISKEIAEILHINTSTVESHKENIRQKLNLKTVVEIVVFALQNGIISYRF
jgi:DNA-binding NarL/FixJ family response regulator